MDIYKQTKSDAMMQKALKVIPQGIYGHLGPGEGCWIPVNRWPKFSERSEASYTWDIDGNRFIDYMCAFGPNVLGYNDPDVTKAALDQIKKSDCTTIISPVTVEFAEILTNMTKKDWAFFAKNGNDVTQFAMMISRYATGRKKMILIKNYYHGVSPWQSHPDVPGTTEEDCKNTLIVPWNDFETLEKVVNQYKGEIAGLMATPYMHGNFVDNELPVDGYWQKVRKLCTDNGIVLTIDDVRCGFRLDLSGSDHYFGFEADLICFCKALANGWPVSAICGKDFLKGAASSIPYTGSYWLQAVPHAAGIACLKKLQAIDGANLMLNQGRKLCAGLQQAADNNNVKFIISGEPSLFYFRIANDDSLVLHQEWVAEMVSRGIFFTSHHNHFTNCSLTDDDIKLTVEIADEAFKIVKKNHPEINW